MNLMPRRARRVVLVLPLLVVATAATTACDIAMADLRQKETAEWRKTYDLKPGGRLEISNVNGRASSARIRHLRISSGSARSAR